MPGVRNSQSGIMLTICPMLSITVEFTVKQATFSLTFETCATRTSHFPFVTVLANQMRPGSPFEGRAQACPICKLSEAVRFRMKISALCLNSFAICFENNQRNSYLGPLCFSATTFAQNINIKIII